MKKIYYFIIALFLFCFSSLQAQTTEGTEFWLTFGQNGVTTIPVNVDLQIRIVSKKNPTTGTIHFTNLGDSVSFSMGAYEVFTHPLDNIQKEAVYNTTIEKNNKTVHINSSEPVKVYALNQLSASTDATNIFPIEVLGSNYYQISYVPAYPYTDAYAVIATEDNTEIYHDGILVDTLNAGQVYYRTAPSLEDMTGAHVTANNPVAFFALNQRAQIPFSAMASDHLFQQLAPVNTWGKNFFVPVSHLTKDRVRIVAAYDNTTIQTDGIFIYSSSGSYTINAGEYIELEALLTNKGCYIHADNRVGVCTYLTGCNYNGSNPYRSDPSLAWLPAIEQMGISTLITPFIPTGTSYLNDHRAIIITPFSTKENTKVSIGGGASVNLSEGSWYDNAEMSFYIMPLYNDTASYYFTNNAGLIVMGYGIGYAESYYYLAGSAMRDLDAAFYANDVHFQELKDIAFCANELVAFRAAIDGEIHSDPEHVKWYIDGVEEVSARDNTEWSKTFLTAGEYEIRMWGRFENEDTISKAGTLRIKNCEQNAVFYKNNVHYLTDTTFCAKDVDFYTDIKGLNTAQDSIKWYIDLGDGVGFVEYVPIRNLKQWSKDFPSGTYDIKMWARLDNDDEIEITGTLKMEVFWIKIKNVRY